MLLVLAALTHRDSVRAEDHVKVPVPLLFTAQDWDPRRQSVKEWLIGRLQETYPLFAGWAGAANASGLIDAGKVTVILDGLDEITEDLRPVALQALDQANFRVVVLSRTGEMASAASQRGVLQGAVAVELRVIDPATAASYLERVQLDPPPDGWHDLVDRIRACPASPLTEALNNPLTLTLIRDTYQSGDDARELLDYCDAVQQRVPRTQAVEEITGYLLDRVLPAAYAPRPGQTQHYDLQTAQNALMKIAAHMNQDGTRDLQWWRIPRWIPSVQRIAVSGVVSGLVAGLVAWVIVGPLAGVGGWVMAGLTFGVVAGVMAGLVAGVAAHRTDGLPAKMGKIRRPHLQRVFAMTNLKLGLAAGVVAGLVFGLVLGLSYGLVIGLERGFVYTVGFGLAVGLGLGLANAFADPDSTSSPSPAVSWHNDRKHSMGIGLLTALVAGPAIGLYIGAGSVIGAGVGTGVSVGVVAVLEFGVGAGAVAGLGISHAWPATLAAAQLAARWHTPLRLMNFLDDARERNVLRTVGPVYQFRHARLQDRLAANERNNSRTEQPSNCPT